MSTLWTYRALYSIGNEFWLCQLLSAAAFRVLHDLDSGPIQVDTFIKACQGLNELSGRFNLARDVLSSIQAVLKRDNVPLPSFATRHFQIGLQPLQPTVIQQTYVPVGLKSGGFGSRSMVPSHRLFRISDILVSDDGETNPD